MLLLKLFLVPFFLALISIAGKRWGASVAGWLAGFPAVAGPILFFLAVERGPVFTAHAATLSLSAVAATVTFCVSYSWACLRWGWFASLCAALSLWCGAVSLLAWLAPSNAEALAIALLSLVAAPRLFPAPPPLAVKAGLPRQELILRMLAGGALTFLVTALSPILGPSWSGLLTVFPVLTIVLSVFSQVTNGPGFVVSLLSAMPLGIYAFTAFCLAVALLLPAAGTTVTFVAATVLAVLVQWMVKRLVPAVPPVASQKRTDAG
jgi:hypothetical protein